jgi:hypothetical protein
MNVAEGWYPDPSDAARERWWDGTRWEAQTRARGGLTPEPVPVAATPTEPVPAYEPVAPAYEAAPVADEVPAHEPVPAFEPVPAYQPAGAQVGVAHLVAPVGDAAVPTLAPLEPRSTTPVLAPLALPEPELAPRPVAVAAPEPVPVPTPAAPAYSPEPGYSPQSAQPAATSFAPEAGFVPGSAGAGSSFGHASGGATSTLTRPGAVPAWGMESQASTVAVGRSGPRPARVILSLLVVAAVVAAAIFVVLPRYRDHQALETASVTATLLPHSAPRTLAGEPRLSVPASAMPAKSTEGTWSWFAAYKTGAFVTIYGAGDLSPADRPDAVRAMTDSHEADDLVLRLTRTLVESSGGTISAGSATEYDDKVIGRTWCLQMDAHGQAGGVCLWTSGREMLVALTIPGTEAMAASHTLRALAQMHAMKVPAASRSTSKTTTKATAKATR